MGFFGNLLNDILKIAQNGLGRGNELAYFKKRLTGADLDTASRWQVAGTDLGIPFKLENGSTGYLFGDTFSTANPFDPNNDWRSPVALRSANDPATDIVFDSAYKVAGNGRAPEIMFNAHQHVQANTGVAPKGNEFTVIPNDGISFPETGRQLVSYMSVRMWGPHNNYPDVIPGGTWRTNYAGLAYSDNGNDFVRTDLKWLNNDTEDDPYQQWSMQRDGDYVYILSNANGRDRAKGMHLRRVHWERMFWPEEYQGWYNNNGVWQWGGPTQTTPLFGNTVTWEPSFRKLIDGKWCMAYYKNGTFGPTLVTRTADNPTGPWTSEKVQIQPWQIQSPYGGFIHWNSSTATNDLHLMVSRWVVGQPIYHVEHWVGTA